MDFCQPRRHAPVHFPDKQVAGPCPHDFTRRVIVDGKIHETTDCAGGADALGDMRLVDAVLQRNDRRLRSQTWQQCSERGVRVLRLDAEKNQV